MPEAARIRSMFAAIAGRYDLVNRVLSCGIDRRWRRRAVRALELAPGARVLDVCAGTGDVSLELARTGATVVGADFCPEMLGLAARKALRRAVGRPRFLCADTLGLPFRGGSFDAATVAFGIRNVADPLLGLKEMRRVVRPGGSVVVLEFCRPRPGLVRGAYLVYLRRVLPRLAGLLSGDRSGAYAYLPDSVLEFPERDAFVALMREAGLQNASYQALTLGVAAIYRARVPSG